MTNKLGLYIKDTSEPVNRISNSNSKTWKRKSLLFNDKNVYTTANIFDSKFGLYAKDNKLMIDSETIAECNNNELEIASSNISKFGDAILAGNICINITKKDYQKLRTGKVVKGYSFYDPKKVYNIVEDVNTSPIVYYNEDLVKDHEDIIYNSFTGDLPERKVDENNQYDINPPSLVVRYFNPLLNGYNSNIVKLELEYFIDTINYDSVVNGIIEDDFTTIITLSNGTIVKNKTYAGQFKISIPIAVPSAKLTDMWFSIQSIDNHGRNSVQYTYDFRIINFTPNIKIFNSPEELKDYGITVGKNVGYEAAYNNAVLFNLMCLKLKQDKYDGVKLFNSYSNGVSDIDNPNNSVYEFDFRWNINHDNYVNYLKNPIDERYIPKPMTIDFYLVKWDRTNRTLHAYNSQTRLFDKLVDYTSGDKNTIINTLSDSKLVNGNSYLVNNKSITVGNLVTINGKTINTPTIQHWVRYDGAEIFRNSGGKIEVMWGNGNDIESTIKHDNYQIRVLHTDCLNTIIAKKEVEYKYINKHNVADGYLYLVYCPFDQAYVWDSRPIFKTQKHITTIPDNFILDLNGSTLQDVNRLYTDDRSGLIFASGSDGVTIKNGKIQGFYNPDNLILAKIGCGFTTGNIGANSGGCVFAFASKYFNMDNIILDGGHGYEIMTTGIGNGDMIMNNGWGYTDLIFDEKPSFTIDSTGNKKSDVIIKDDKNHSLITPEHPSYDANENINVCVITTEINTLPKTLMKASVKSMALDTSDALSSLGKYTPMERDDNELYITFSLKYGLYGGVYPYYFIHFYNENGEYLNTIKTEQNVAIKIPKNAKKFRVSTYGLCKIDNNDNVIEVLKDETGTKIKWVTEVVEGAYLKLSKEGPTKNFVLKNSIIRNTRSCCLGNTGINWLVDNCIFSKIAAAPINMGATKYIMDNEEHRYMTNICCLKNTTVDYSPRTDSIVTCDLPSKVLGAINACRFILMDNCEGFFIKVNTKGGYFANNKFYKILLDMSQNSHTPFGFIFKNNKVLDKSIISQSCNVAAVRSCFRELSKTIRTENCIMDRNSGTSEYGGLFSPMRYLSRQSYFFDTTGSDTLPDFSYSENYTRDKIKSLWKLKDSYDNTDGDNGWIHCIVFVGDKPFSTQISYHLHLDNFVKENGKPLAYIDGVKSLDAITDISGNAWFTVNDKGYHIISYRLNTLVLTTSSTILHVPSGLLAQMPATIGTYTVNGQLKLMTLKDKLGTAGSRLALRKSTPLIIKGNAPFGIYRTTSGNYSFHNNIYVDEDCVETFKNFYESTGLKKYTTIYPYKGLDDIVLLS